MTTTKALAPVDELKNTLMKMEPQFKMALPPHVSPQKFIRIIQTAVSTTPALVQSSRTSLFAACMKAAQSGLLPDGREAAIVTFNVSGVVTAQFMPMTEGIMKLVRNSGELASLTSQIVHKNDVFKYWVDGDGEHVNHEPLMFGERGDVLGVYALAKLKDGSIYIEVMTASQIMDVKNVSRGKNGPWSGPFESEMWRKSAIKRLAKRLPKSTDLEAVIRVDDELTDFTQQETQQEVKTKSKRLSKLIKEKTEEIELEPEQEFVDVKVDAPL